MLSRLAHCISILQCLPVIYRLLSYADQFCIEFLLSTRLVIIVVTVCDKEGYYIAWQSPLRGSTK